MRESGEQTPELGGAGRALCGDVVRVSPFTVDGRISLEDVVSACPSPYCSLSYAAVRYQHHSAPVHFPYSVRIASTSGIA